MERKCKWKSIYEQLKIEIENGKHKKGNKFFTLLKSADVMMDELGCGGVFIDGVVGYDSQWTYNCWDGHSVEIGPRAKTIKRKMGNVFLLSQDALVAFMRRIHDREGAVIANNCEGLFTRTICNEKYVIHDLECHPFPSYHLSPTVITLGHHTVQVDEEHTYLDVYDKLKMGSLYFYYGERDRGLLKHQLLRLLPIILPARLFPSRLAQTEIGLSSVASPGLCSGTKQNTL